jgi:hypothetical protein
MKKTILILTMLMGTFAADASDYPYLVFQTTGGSKQSIAVENLTLTISDGKLVAKNETTNQNYLLSELSEMYFSTTVTGIENVNASAQDEGVEVYSASGISFGKFSSVDEARVLSHIW